MDLLEMVIQRRSGDGYPIVANWKRSGDFLPQRREGMLLLDQAAKDELFQAQIDPLAYGTILGRALFQGTIRDALREARAQSGVHLRLPLIVEDPELRSLHWENLCAPIGVGGAWRHLALDQRALFSLYLPSLTDRRFPAIGRRDLRALVVVANPPDGSPDPVAPFDGPGTVASVRQALGDIPHQVLANVEGADGKPTLDQICQRIIAEHFTLLHIVAHGWYREGQGETLLYLLDNALELSPIPASLLIERLDRLQGARGLPHLTFLATCESAAPEAEREGALGGLAQRLVRDLGMPAVIAMTRRVSISAATALAGGFYERLYVSGDVNRALVEAGTRLAGTGEATVPALYERLGGRPLFSDTLDRELTNAEVTDGLNALEELLPQRAPILQAAFAEQATALRRYLDTPREGLAAEARTEWQEALDGVNAICEEVLDLNFRALALQTGQPPAYDGRCPFPGLKSFSFKDRPFFFGREPLVKTLQARLAEHNFLAVLGPSGSGKSSLVLAGLLPALQEAEADLQLAYLKPGSDPMAQLEASLAQVQDGPALLVVDQFEEAFTLCTDQNQRQAFFQRLLALAAEMPTVLTMRADFWGDCAPYPKLRAEMQAHQELIAPMTTAELRSAMEQQAAAVRLRFEADLSDTILDSVREEPGAMPLLQHALSELWLRRHGRWLQAAEYRALGGVQQAIARTADGVYDDLPQADQKLLSDLFLRLTRLDEKDLPGHERRDTRRRVDLADLVPAGSDLDSVKALVAKLADARLVVTRLNALTRREEVEVAHEALIRHWPRLRRWLDEDRDLLRLRAQIGQEAREWRAHKEDQSYLLYHGTRLEEAEALCRQGRLSLNRLEQRYLDACVALRQQREQEAEAQRQRELEAARELAAEADARRKAETERAEEQSRAAARLRKWAAVLGVVLALALIAAALAGIFWQQSTANEQEAVAAQGTAESERDRANVESTKAVAEWDRANAESTKAIAAGGTAVAERDRANVESTRAIEAEGTAVAEKDRAEEQARSALVGQLAALSQTESEEYPQRSVLLAIEAISITMDHGEPRIPAAEQALRDALLNIGGMGLAGHDSPVRQVLISPDSRWLVTVSEDPSVILWDLTAWPVGEEHTFLHHALAGTSVSAAISPDSRWLIISTPSGEGPISVWDLTDDSLSSPFTFLEGTRPHLSSNPKGSYVATIGVDGQVLVWNLQELQVTYPFAPPVTLPLDSGFIIDAMEFDSQGDHLFTVDNTGRVLLWDLDDSEAPPVFLGGHTTETDDDRLYVVKYITTSQNGKWLAVGYGDGTVLLWDLDADLSAQPTRLQGHSSAIHYTTIDPTSHWLMTGSRDDIILWDLWQDSPSNHALSLNVRYHGHGTAMSTDGHWLADNSGLTPRIWDLTAADPSAEMDWIGSCDEKPVYAIALSSNGHWLVGGSHGAACLWDLRSEEPAAEPILLHGHEGGRGQDDIRAVAFSPDGRWLITGGRDGTVRLRPIGSSGIVASPLVFPRAATFPAEEVSPDERWLATYSASDSVRLWDLQSEDPASNPIELPHKGSIQDLAFGPGQGWLVTGCDDDVARLWNLQADNPAANPIELPHDDDVMAVALSPKGWWLATGSSDSYARVWDLRAGLRAGEARELEHQNEVLRVVFSPDDRWLITRDTNRAAWLWDLQVDDPVPTSLGGFREHTWASQQELALGPEGRWLATAPADEGVWLWDLEGNDPTSRPLMTSSEAVLTLGFSPKGRWLAAGGNRGHVWLWDMMAEDPAASYPQQPLGHASSTSIYSVAFSPDEQWLATSGADYDRRGEDDTARLWSLEGGYPLTDSLVLRHDADVRSVVFSPDGHWLLTNGDESFTRLWDLRVKDPTLDPMILGGTEGRAWARDFSPNARWLVGSEDYSVLLWHMNPDELVALACRAAGRNLSWTEWQRYLGDQAYRPTCTNPPVLADPEVAVSDLEEALDLVESGEADAAMAHFRRAVGLAADRVLLADYAYQMCWQGSLSGVAPQVRYACEYAVALSPNDPYNLEYRKSRALARALTGHLQGAVEDLEVYLTWSEWTGLYDSVGAETESWIDALRAGRNPFDEETLARLRNE